MSDPRIEELMVKVVDGLATPAEEQELMTHVAEHPEQAVELDAHRGLKALTDGWVERLHLDQVEDQFTSAPVARAELWVGTTLTVLGLSILFGWGLVAVVVDPTAPVAVRAGLGALGAGAFVLLFSVLRWHLATRKHDRYTKVIR
ncbi:MAG: hypothetical protein GXP62_12485 [Oligoflexia bacterium]|nr:hypothetical protein [Oligoflexia bacterium]